MLTRLCWLCSCAQIAVFVPFYLTFADGETVYGEQLFGTFRLKEYSNFGDVTLFHVTIPPHCVSARWDVGVLKNDIKNCPRTKADLAIQAGSLPLTNPLNASFPTHTVTASRRYLNLIPMMSDQPISISFGYPQPGNWYMATFLPRSESSKIEQQGLGGVTCRYYIQVGVSYWQEQDIRTLSAETSTKVKLSADTKQTTAIYRFYVPPLTKMVNFSYHGCTANQTGDSLCPVDLRVRVNSLPSLRTTPPVICKPTARSCSEQVDEPLGEEWYYVQLDLQLSAGPVEVDLSLSVQTEACTEEYAGQLQMLVDQEEVQPSDFVQNASLASPQLEYHLNASLTTYDPSSSKLAPLESLRAVHLPSDYLSPLPTAQSSPFVPGWCPPVIALSSAQLGGSNPFKTFVLNTANSTGSVDVPPDSPVILRFDLDPLQDIGGNLIIDGLIAKEAEDGSLEYDNITFISLCLRRGAIPHLNGTQIICDPDYSVTFNNGSSSTALPWIVPFPAPGVWYLSLVSMCASNSGLVPCNWTTFVSLDISLYGCIDNCGQYGSCHSSVDMGILYYYCKCSRAYRGWGCTDDSEAWSESYFLTRVLLLTLSNVFFIFPCLLAVKRRHFVPAISFFCTLIFSSFYHSCDSGSLCIMPFDTLQYCDFYSAFMSIFLTLITMAKLPMPLKNSLEILGAFGMALGTSYNRFSLWAVAIPVGVGLAVMLISWSRRWYKRRQCYPTTKWRWLLFILPGTAVIITGLCIFAFLETSDNYQYVHSAWHVAMAIGVSFLLPPRERSDYALVHNAQSDVDLLRTEDIHPSLLPMISP